MHELLQHMVSSSWKDEDEVIRNEWTSEERKEYGILVYWLLLDMLYFTIVFSFGLCFNNLDANLCLCLTNQVTLEPQYRDKIAAASRLFRSQFHVPKDEAAFWLDHVMEYGGAYMRSSGHDMPLYQFLLIDVSAFLTAGLLAFLALIITFLYIFVRVLCTRTRRRWLLSLVVSEKQLFEGKKNMLSVCRKLVRACKRSYLGVTYLLPMHCCLHENARQTRYFTKELERLWIPECDFRLCLHHKYHVFKVIYAIFCHFYTYLIFQRFIRFIYLSSCCHCNVDFFRRNFLIFYYLCSMIISGEMGSKYLCVCRFRP